MRKTRLLSLLVLLMTAATSAWAVIHSSYTVKMKDGTDDITNWSLTPHGSYNHWCCEWLAGDTHLLWREGG